MMKNGDLCQRFGMKTKVNAQLMEISNQLLIEATKKALPDKPDNAFLL